ncbi:MAG TPA: replication-associated recombination protein A [Acidimicrobiales bacterium]|jgi:putative ATPase|nr:replication-associated recombination protein A [Acidimicrobiales bacterium]
MPAGGRQPDDLFEAALRDRLAQRAPLAARMRPQRLDDIAGQRHLIGPGAPLRALIESDRLTSVVLWGPPGTGKTTLASVVAAQSRREFVSLSAVTAGVKDVREVLEAARRRLAEEDRGTILFLDEVHRFNKSQQDALLPGVEAGIITLIGATTENPFFEVNAPLLSRSTVFRLEPLSDPDVAELVDRAITHEGARIDEDAAAHLVDLAGGDARAALTALEMALALAESDGRSAVGLADVERARQSRVLRYGDDEHYDVISAFIKSIRGSDPDAGLYWLARMLRAGEDARFIARRLVILASEDIGMADPMSLVIADAAARAVEFVGLPEAQLNLAQAVVHLASAPKSNTVMAALARAFDDVEHIQAGAVPAPLRSVHPYQARKMHEGGGYVYPHNDPAGFVDQEYRPAEVAGRVYYRPSPHGHEARAAARLRALWGDEAYDLEEWWRFKKFSDPSR